MVRAHDPIALEAVKNHSEGRGIEFCESVHALAQNADALVLATEWQHYCNLPWSELGTIMRGRLIVDGRNFLDKKDLEANGFRYMGMGIFGDLIDANSHHRRGRLYRQSP